MHKYSYLKDFLEDNRTRQNMVPHSVPLLVDCVARQDNSAHRFSVKDDRCINCMFCLLGCPGNRILLADNFHPKEFCSDAAATQREDMNAVYTERLLNGTFIKLPPVSFGNIRPRYRCFEDFTGVDETKNIAVWTANVMRFLSESANPRMALEVGVRLEQRDRGGRLDVALLNTDDKYLFVAETKVSFNKMMEEGRYESQLLGYETELESVGAYGYRHAKFLVIGGRESDLLCNTQLYSTSGTRGALFYSILRKHNFFFFSANALLALALKKLFVASDRYSLEALYTPMTCGDYVGLLSCGLVRSDGSIEPY